MYISPRKTEHIAKMFLSGAGQHVLAGTMIGATYSPSKLWSQLSEAKRGNPKSESKDAFADAAANKSTSMKVEIEKRDANRVLREIESAETPEEVIAALEPLTMNQIAGISQAVSGTRLSSFRQKMIPESVTEAHVMNNVVRLNDPKFTTLMEGVAPTRGSDRAWFQDHGIV